MSDSTGNKEKIKEIHPDWYRDVFPMYYLILGSFPPHSKRWDYPFYYPNKINRFWKILAEIAKVNLTVPIISEKNAVDERFSIMQKLNTGVQNLGKTILRKGTSALDTDIEITTFQDILAILQKHPELKKILLSGYSSKNSTAQSFLKYINQTKEIEITDSIPKTIYSGTFFQIRVDGRIIDCVVLNSTSTASRISYDDVKAQFERELNS